MKKALLVLVFVAMAVPATAKPKKPNMCAVFDCTDVVEVKVPKRKMDNEKTVIVVPRGKSFNRKAFCKAFVCGDTYVVVR